jgi:hypothetical protein
MEVHSFSNNRILGEQKVTLLDSLFNYPLRPESTHLKHFLETNNIVVLNNLHDLKKSLFFVIIKVGLDGRRA